MKIKAWHKQYLIILAIFLFAGYIAFKLVYNKLVDEEHFLHIAHGRLEATMQKRQDLVTGTISAVNSYVKIEGMLIERLVTLNGMIESGIGGSMQKGMKTEIIALLNNMALLAEAYPDLRSSGPYVYLMETLQYTGRRVTEARMEYNNRAYEYNMICRIFPFNLVSVFLGFGREHFFEAQKKAFNPVAIESLQMFGKVLQ